MQRGGKRTPGILSGAGGLLYGVVSFGLIIAGWWLLALTNLVGEGLLPTPSEVFSTWWTLMATESLWLDIALSTRRVLIGVFTGLALAIPVGFVLGWYAPVRKFVDPIINFFRALPPIALIPLVIVYFGIGEPARVSVLTYAAFFSGIIVIYEGIKLIPPIYIRVARSLGARDSEIFRRVVVPAALPHVLTAFRVAVGVCWTTLVAAELVAAQRGLGAVIVSGQNYFQVPKIFVGIIMIGTVALVMDKLLRVITARLLSWQETLG